MLNKGRLMALVLAVLTLPAWAQTPRGHSVSGSMQRISKRGFLGVGVADVTDERASALKLSADSGVEVKRVDASSPAEKAGLKVNDVILEVNGQKVEGVEEFIRVIGDSAPGSKVNLTVWRNGTKQNVSATLEARPAQFFTFSGPNGDWVAPMPPLPPDGWDDAFSGFPPFLRGESPRIGIQGETLTPQLAEFFGVKAGVLVQTVAPNSPAQKAGLKAGDVITKVAGTPVTSPREIAGLVRMKGKNLAFTVVRNHKEIVLNVQVAAEWNGVPEREVL